MGRGFSQWRREAYAFHMPFSLIPTDERLHTSGKNQQSLVPSESV